jgi:hypothetical protein
VPELGAVEFPAEPLATCRTCAMAPKEVPAVGVMAATEIVFTAPARCCTYQPKLPNWAVGRILRRGGIGAERVRAKIAAREGIHPIGLQPAGAWRKAWDGRGANQFGREPAFTCPYWVEGTELACSIHADREAVCRTWHCKYGAGARSHAAWAALHALLQRIERALAQFCLDHVPEDSDPERYYLACAARVDRMTPEELAPLRTIGVRALVDELHRRVEDRDAPMPEVLQPRVRDWATVDGETVLVSLSQLDREPVPAWIFELLSRLDGVRPWRDAVAGTAEAIGQPVDEDLVRRLWARGLLGPPDNSPDVVFSYVPGD